MKKLTVLFAILMAASVVFAQKTTWLNQAGNSNLATITQSACKSGDAQYIYATQSGNSNSMYSTQTGNYNYLSLLQSGNGNAAYMDQYTCDATTNPGGDNIADVVQSGNDNHADLMQEEDNVDGMDYSDNVATATQSGKRNNYYLSQGSHKWTPNNFSYLTQSGKSNNAWMDQIGQTQYSEILQTSNAVTNYAELDQSGQSGMSSSWDKSYSWQYGVSNAIYIHQDGNPGLEYAKSIQNGSGNYTDIYQSSWQVQQVKSDQFGTDIINVTQVN